MIAGTDASVPTNVAVPVSEPPQLTQATSRAAEQQMQHKPQVEEAGQCGAHEQAEVLHVGQSVQQQYVHQDEFQKAKAQDLEAFDLETFILREEARLAGLHAAVLVFSLLLLLTCWANYFWGLASFVAAILGIVGSSMGLSHERSCCGKTADIRAHSMTIRNLYIATSVFSVIGFILASTAAGWLSSVNYDSSWYAYNAVIMFFVTCFSAVFAMALFPISIVAACMCGRFANATYHPACR